MDVVERSMEEAPTPLSSIHDAASIDGDDDWMAYLAISQASEITDLILGYWWIVDGDVFVMGAFSDHWYRNHPSAAVFQQLL